MSNQAPQPPLQHEHQHLWGHLVDFRRYLLDERQFSEATARAYCSDLKPILAEAARLGLTDVLAWQPSLLRDTVAQARNRFDSGPACGRTVARKHSALRAFYEWLLRQSDQERDPTDTLVAPVQLRKLPRPVHVEAALLMAAPPPEPNWREARAAAAMMLLYGCGLRLGEAARLLDSQLDLGGPTVEVSGSGKLARQVPVPALCVPHLALWRSMRPPLPGPTFLIGRGGGPLSCRSIGREAGRIAAERLGKHLSPRQLRHSFAVHLLDHGANLRQVQSLLGHARVTSTQIYHEVSLTQLRQAHARAHPSEQQENTDMP